MSKDPLWDYIGKRWNACTIEDRDGSGFQCLDLPYPYTTPCARSEGHFTFFFYWDTYFTNLGLIKQGFLGTAKNNIRNIIWLIDRQGYMPNHVGIFNRSQPPMLCRMVMDYLAVDSDESFYAECARALRQEYNFWITARTTPSGLQRFGMHETAEGAAKFYKNKRILRIGYSESVPLEEKARIGAQFLAEAESGWDFTQRFQHRCLDYNAVDLNSLLYEYEVFLADASEALGWGDAGCWKERSHVRKERVHALMWSPGGNWFYDYDYVRKEVSPVLSCAGFFPLACGVARQDHADSMCEEIDKVELPFGLAATEEYPRCEEYQWAYPSSWPPLNYMAVAGLHRYGLCAEAHRIARTHIDAMRNVFAQTGQLWEKLNAKSGQVANSEYKAPPMMGWTAGVYVALVSLIEEV